MKKIKNSNIKIQKKDFNDNFRNFNYDINDIHNINVLISKKKTDKFCENSETLIYYKKNKTIYENYFEKNSVCVRI